MYTYPSIKKGINSVPVDGSGEGSLSEKERYLYIAIETVPHFSMRVTEK